MLRPWQFWTFTGTSGLALVLALTNMVLFQTNRGLQEEANSRAQYIQQSVALEGLYREIVKALADRALATRDDQVRDLLAAEGFNLTFDAAPAGGDRQGQR
jgi:hypothetical protein